MMETRYNLEEWLEHALEALANKGPEILSIQRLCGYLGVSRGSFYWHFKNRDDFIQKLVQFWVRRMTNAVIDAAKELEGNPQETLMFLTEKIIDTDASRYDIPIRAWAATNPVAAAAVKRADKARYAILKELFRGIGFDGDELEMRVRTYMVFYSMEKSSFVRETRKERIARSKLRHKLLARPTS